VSLRELYTQYLQELGVPFISISAPSIVSGMSGESEKTLRDAFEEAKVPIRYIVNDAL
jgi:SpoVK/Ycf46/Vps4 family AAA+-type ATPase